MASIKIRNLNDDLKAALRAAAAEHGHSIEEEVRVILCERLKPRQGRQLGTLISNRFGSDTGVELAIPPRGTTPRFPGS